MRVKILGRTWKLVMVPRGESFVVYKGNDDDRTFSKTDRGLTEAPHIKGKRILIRENMSQLDELDTTLHEGLHAADWSKDEEWIEEAAHDIARLLWRMGWRKVGKRKE